MTTTKSHAAQRWMNGDDVFDVLTAGTAFLSDLGNSADAVPGLQAAALMAKELVAVARVRLRCSKLLLCLIFLRHTNRAQQQGRLPRTCTAGHGVPLRDRMHIQCISRARSGRPFPRKCRSSVPVGVSTALSTYIENPCVLREFSAARDCMAKLSSHGTLLRTLWYQKDKQSIERARSNLAHVFSRFNVSIFRCP